MQSLIIKVEQKDLNPLLELEHFYFKKNTTFKPKINYMLQMSMHKSVIVVLFEFYVY